MNETRTKHTQKKVFLSILINHIVSCLIRGPTMVIYRPSTSMSSINTRINTNTIKKKKEIYIFWFNLRGCKNEIDENKQTHSYKFTEIYTPDIYNISADDTMSHFVLFLNPLNNHILFSIKKNNEIDHPIRLTDCLTHSLTDHLYDNIHHFQPRLYIYIIRLSIDITVFDSIERAREGLKIWIILE